MVTVSERRPFVGVGALHTAHMRHAQSYAILWEPILFLAYRSVMIMQTAVMNPTFMRPLQKKEQWWWYLDIIAQLPGYLIKQPKMKPVLAHS